MSCSLTEAGRSIVLQELDCQQLPLVVPLVHRGVHIEAFRSPPLPLRIDFRAAISISNEGYRSDEHLVKESLESQEGGKKLSCVVVSIRMLSKNLGDEVGDLFHFGENIALINNI